MATSPRSSLTTIARAGLPALGALVRLALLTAPPLLLRAALSPRGRQLSDLSDRELADIGLARGDVERPSARPVPGWASMPVDPARHR